MDIEKIIEQIVEKLAGDDQLMEKFKADPAKTIKNALKLDLDEEVLEAVIKAVKAKIDLDDLKDKAGDLLGGLKGLFGK
ncbi:MAG: hypothetical protein IJD39_12210 [Clostridia bacterium]|nr:hypothetical protein [Clostridia bacterium]